MGYFMKNKLLLGIFILINFYNLNAVIQNQTLFFLKELKNNSYGTVRVTITSKNSWDQKNYDIFPKQTYTFSGAQFGNSGYKYLSLKNTDTININVSGAKPAKNFKNIVSDIQNLRPQDLIEIDVDIDYNITFNPQCGCTEPDAIKENRQTNSYNDF